MLGKLFSSGLRSLIEHHISENEADYGGANAAKETERGKSSVAEECREHCLRDGDRNKRIAKIYSFHRRNNGRVKLHGVVKAYARE